MLLINAKNNPSYTANVAIVTTPPQKNVNKNIKLSKMQLGNDPR